MYVMIGCFFGGGMMVMDSFNKGGYERKMYNGRRCHLPL